MIKRVCMMSYIGKFM